MTCFYTQFNDLACMSSRSSVNRAPTQCMESHRFDSHWGLRFFSHSLCSTLETCLSFPLLTKLVVVNKPAYSLITDQAHNKALGLRAGER